MKYHLFVLTTITLLFFPDVNFAQAPNLGTAANFALFTTTGAVGNTAISTITGKIGTNTGAITGFTFEPGQEENANSVTAQAALDLQAAYNEMYIATQTFPTHGPILGNGETLIPGIYLISEAASIEGNLIMDGQGNSNSIFIIKILGAFSPGPSSQISLTGGALACNIFWAVEGGAVAIATLAEMKGTFIANPGAVSMAATSQLDGRLLSTTGAVAVDGVTTALPGCIDLPVTLIDFNATKRNDIIELSWTVENEFFFAGYELERSADGRNFNKIGSVTPTNTNFKKTYNWLDNIPNSINFYRLKMVNMDNGFKYSRVLKISMQANKSIACYPNPVVDHILILQMYNQRRGEHILDIYNIAGIKVMRSKILLNENDVVRSITLDKSLTAGTYILQLTDPANKTETLKIQVR